MAGFRGVKKFERGDEVLVEVGKGETALLLGDDGANFLDTITVTGW
jgi:hypothetical protein